MPNTLRDDASAERRERCGEKRRMAMGGRRAVAWLRRVVMTGLTVAGGTEKSYDHMESMKLCMERQGQRTESVSADQGTRFLL
jgi:hypothetical protein